MEEEEEEEEEENLFLFVSVWIVFGSFSPSDMRMPFYAAAETRKAVPIVVHK